MSKLKLYAVLFCAVTAAGTVTQRARADVGYCANWPEFRRGHCIPTDAMMDQQAFVQAEKDAEFARKEAEFHKSLSEPRRSEVHIYHHNVGRQNHSEDAPAGRQQERKTDLLKDKADGSNLRKTKPAVDGDGGLG